MEAWRVVMSWLLYKRLLRSQLLLVPAIGTHMVLKHNLHSSNHAWQTGPLTHAACLCSPRPTYSIGALSIKYILHLRVILRQEVHCRLCLKLILATHVIYITQVEILTPYPLSSFFSSLCDIHTSYF
jgi:hypothetical protein